MYCENCGAKLENNAKFCQNCGEIVSLKDKKANGSLKIPVVFLGIFGGIVIMAGTIFFLMNDMDTKTVDSEINSPFSESKHVQETYNTLSESNYTNQDTKQEENDDIEIASDNVLQEDEDTVSASSEIVEDGITICYQSTEEYPSEVDMNDTIMKIEQRLSYYFSEFGVYQEGKNRICITVPRLSDSIGVLEKVGRVGSFAIQTEDNEILLTDEDARDAQAEIRRDEFGNEEIGVKVILTEDGAEKISDYTSNHMMERLYILWNGYVTASPTIESHITNGEINIPGMGSYEEAQELAEFLNIGSLKLQLNEVAN